VFSLPVRVYWEDTDAGGVVYHAQYLAFLERARSEWLRSLGRDQELLRREHDLVFAVRAMQVDFRAPARLDDLLEATVALRECRNASMVFAQEVRRDGGLLLSASVRVACLAASSFRPRALPDALLDELKALEERD
jgi:acyl-CoA thioester hydrolase